LLQVTQGKETKIIEYAEFTTFGDDESLPKERLSSKSSPQK